MDVTLVLVRADGTKRDIPMKRARLLIGRKKECDIRIPVATVSREHCEVTVADGGVTVRDLGSSNGTYVNRERVQEVELDAGDLVAVGPVVFLVKLGSEPEEVNPKELFAQGSPPQPVAAAAAPPGGRPAAPVAPPSPAADDDLEDSSLSGIDFNFDDEDEPKKKL